MPVYLTGRGATKPVAIRDLFYSKDANGIVLRADNQDEVILNCPIDCSAGFNADEYTAHLFRNKFIVQSSIFEVHLQARKNRIGWLVPITALESQDYGLRDPSHFLNYARAAIYKLFKSDKEIHPEPAVSPGSTGKVNLTDFYPDDTVIFITSNKVLAKIPGFTLNHYSHAFFGYGYASYEADIHPSNEHSRIERNFRQVDKILVIKPISAILSGNSYIESITGGSVNLRSHPLTQFLSLYQIFELLIERVFLNEKAISGISITPASSPSEIRDAVGRLQQALAEEGRLHKLWSGAYLNAVPDSNYLNSACIELLKKVGRDDTHNFIGNFYKVRNTVVHDYRSVSGIADRELDEVISELMALIPEILTNYKEEVPVKQGATPPQLESTPAGTPTLINPVPSDRMAKSKSKLVSYIRSLFEKIRYNFS